MTYTDLITSEHADKPKFMEMVALCCAPFAENKRTLESLHGVIRFSQNPSNGDYLLISDKTVGFVIESSVGSTLAATKAALAIQFPEYRFTLIGTDLWLSTPMPFYLDSSISYGVKCAGASIPSGRVVSNGTIVFHSTPSYGDTLTIGGATLTFGVDIIPSTAQAVQTAFQKVLRDFSLDLPTVLNIDPPYYDRFAISTTSSSIGITDDSYTISYLKDFFDLDIATGKQLDVLGEWIGCNRIVPIDVVSTPFFSLDDADKGLDSIALLYTPGITPLYIYGSLADDDYRVLLRARVLNNIWDGTSVHGNALMNLVFNSDFFIIDNADLSMSVGLVGVYPISTALKTMLVSGELSVKPAGILLREVFYLPASLPIFALDLETAKYKGLDEGYMADVFVPPTL